MGLDCSLGRVGSGAVIYNEGRSFDQSIFDPFAEYEIRFVGCNHLQRYSQLDMPLCSQVLWMRAIVQGRKHLHDYTVQRYEKKEADKDFF